MKMLKRVGLTLAFLFALGIPSLANQYVIRGRTVDDRLNGVSAYVFILPLVSQRYGVYRPVKSGADGHFLARLNVEDTDRWYFWASSAAPGLNSRFLPLTPPFLQLLSSKNYRGKKISFTQDPFVDLGDIHVDFKYGDVNVSFVSIIGNSNVQQWKNLVISIRDETGKDLGKYAIDPVTPSNVDMERGVLKLSLPIGRWSLTVYRLSATGDVEKKPIGETPMLTISYKQTTENVAVEPKIEE